MTNGGEFFALATDPVEPPPVMLQFPEQVRTLHRANIYLAGGKPDADPS